MQHCPSVDPSSEWKRGSVGYLVRLRGLFTILAADGALAWLAFLHAHWIVGVVLVNTGIFLAAWVFTVRYYRIRRAESDQSLHFFFHNSRDIVSRFWGKHDEATHLRMLDEFHKDTVQRIAKFFRDRIGDPSVNCAIRLAESQNGAEQYVTVARSDGMEPSRSSTTEPIPADKGLAKALLTYDKQGVVIIRDIPEAAKGPYWYGSRNNHLPDVQTLMAAPINGWEGGSKVMLGILYVTSRKNVFHEGHTLPMKAFADYLGLVYPPIIRR